MRRSFECKDRRRAPSNRRSKNPPLLPWSCDLDKASVEVCLLSDGHNMYSECSYILAGATPDRAGWRTIINCLNVVTIVSVTLGLAGVIVGVLGWLASLRGLRESAEARAQERTAQEAASAARQELLLQRAAEDFRIIVENVEELAGRVASADWMSARALLAPLKRRLSEANGSFQKILLESTWISWMLPFAP